MFFRAVPMKDQILSLHLSIPPSLHLSTPEQALEEQEQEEEKSLQEECKVFIRVAVRLRGRFLWVRGDWGLEKMGFSGL